MKLVQGIEKNDLLSSDWGIYELDNEEKKKYGNNFVLSQGIFSDWAIKEFGVDKLLKMIDRYKYEGFFETQKEAYMQVKLVEMKCKIDRIEYAIKEVLNLETPKW